MRFKIGFGLRHLAGILAAVVFLLPLYWIGVTSLRMVGAPPSLTIEWWPADPQWQNYLTIFELTPMARYLRNSVIVVAVASPLSIIVASLAGFSLAQLPDRFRRPVVYTTVGLLIVPSASVWIFRFQILSWLGLIDTLWALIAPAFGGTNPLYILLFYWTFRRAPAEIFEAARLEGASVLQSWWRIGLPLAVPAVMAVGVLSAVHYWSDFVGPVLYIYQPRWYTLPIGLQILKQLDVTNWPLLMAGAVVMTVPVAIVFLAMQRFFLNELAQGSLLDQN
jgi:multiple sugar transport system permease protein